MASAKPGVHVVQLKPVQVVQTLIQGSKCLKWEDETSLAAPVTLAVDKNGFYLHWTDQNQETELLDLTTIRDTRTGRYARVPKEGKLRDSLQFGDQDCPLEDKTMTVVYGSDFVNVCFIHFCFATKEEAKLFTDEILKIAYNLLAHNAPVCKFLEKAYTKVCLQKDRENRISIKNVVKLFASGKTEKVVYQCLKEVGLPCDKNETVSLEKFTFHIFMNFYQHLVSRQEVVKIFEHLCCDSGTSSKKGKLLMNVDQLVDFLNKEQRDPRLNEILYPYAKRARGKEIIAQYEPNKSNIAKGLLSFEGFLRYLLSDDNTIVSPEILDLNADMDQPYNHYFINSSHNTYLTGHQLTGRSSVEMYRQCLLAGCRCVELDCWNGKNDDEPIITHGYTVVTEISLKETLEAIAESAFKTSELPVVLSFENHCSPKQQAKIAQYCRKIFGDMLVTEPLPEYPLKPGVPLPSPRALVRRIIIKNKKKHHYRGKKKALSAQQQQKQLQQQQAQSHQQQLQLQAQQQEKQSIITDQTTDSGAGFMSESSVSGTESSKIVTSCSPERTRPQLVASNSDESSKDDADDFSTVTDDQAAAIGGAPVSTDSTGPSAKAVEGSGTKAGAGSCDIDEMESDSSLDEEDSTAQEEVVPEPVQDTTSKESEAGAEMSALVIYIQPIRFHSFEYAKKRNRSYEISSFVESQATSLLKEHPVEFVNLNKRQLTRIYPKGTRVDSSNYMPQVFWNAGCQMVALNFQTLDLGMQLNLGIFEYNGRNGYLLKPDFMRRQDRRFDPFTESTVDGIIAGSVAIKIISGQFLSDKKVGTYVEVDMYGLPADTVRRRRTKIVPANGINPIYDEEPFVFKKVVLPELASLRIAAYEEGGKMIGHRVLPVVGLRPGFRHISLRNESGQPLLLPTLFVHVTVKDYIPDDLSELADALANPIAYQSMVEKRAKQLQALTGEDVQADGTSTSVAPTEGSSSVEPGHSVISHSSGVEPPHPKTSVVASSSPHPQPHTQSHSHPHSIEPSTLKTFEKSSQKTSSSPEHTTSSRRNKGIYSHRRRSSCFVS